MEKVKINVEGMSCPHCEKAVSTALTDLGVVSVEGAAENNCGEVEFDPAVVTLDAIKKEIVEAGYETE